MKLVDRERKKSTFEIIGEHVEKYRISMIVVSIVVSLIALFFCIYWQFDENSGGALSDNLYLASHITFLILSQIMLIFLILNKYKKVSTKVLSIYTHIHSFLLISWATFVCVLDLDLGITPFIYLIAATVIAGLFILEPIFYTVCALASFLTILIFQIINRFTFFEGPYQFEHIAEMVIFVGITIFICFRHFNVTISEHKAKKRLEEMTYYDELTGLLNERSYVTITEQINENIKNEKEEPFAVILMDVNNLKATNDAYGHRYGCSLVVKCGHTLPELFTTSKLFHVGGDEFVAIVVDEDYENFDSLYNHFLEVMTYSLVEFEGVELIFSVASGYAKYEKGDRYQDVLQRADKMMYQNKAEIKAKYNMKGR